MRNRGAVALSQMDTIHLHANLLWFTFLHWSCLWALMPTLWNQHSWWPCLFPVLFDREKLRGEVRRLSEYWAPCVWNCSDILAVAYLLLELPFHTQTLGHKLSDPWDSKLGSEGCRHWVSRWDHPRSWSHTWLLSLMAQYGSSRLWPQRTSNSSFLLKRKRVSSSIC